MSVSHTPNHALLRTLVMLNSGLRPSFDIDQCSQLGLVWGTGHWYSVHTIEEEESHHAGVDLVVKQPLGPGRGGLAHTGEGVEARGTGLDTRTLHCTLGHYTVHQTTELYTRTPENNHISSQRPWHFMIGTTLSVKVEHIFICIYTRISAKIKWHHQGSPTRGPLLSQRATPTLLEGDP